MASRARKRSGWSLKEMHSKSLWTPVKHAVALEPSPFGHLRGLTFLFIQKKGNSPAADEVRASQKGTHDRIP